MGMTTPRLILYILSMVVAVALIFVGCVHLVLRELGGLSQLGIGLGLVLLNSSRVDRA
jgi:hypothetical protein